MLKMYMVAGNNLFRQWISKNPVLDAFEVLEENICLTSELYDFNNMYAKLVNICWSYNIFQCENIFFITGMWNNNDLIKKIDVFKDAKLKSLDLLAVGNDFTLYILNAKESKICIMSLIGSMEVIHLNLEIEHQLVKPKDLKVLKMIASNNAIFFLTKSGYLFSGIPPKYFDTSYCTGNVCDIVCGYDHYILLTDAGSIYTWGSGQRFQLGHGEVEYVQRPKEVEALAGLKICKIAAGGFHSMALSEFGDIYVWGWNDEGQLGVTPEKKVDETFNCPVPKLLDIYDKHGRNVHINIIDIACGSMHSIIKLEDNTVWATGYNKYGQLGISSKKCQSVKYFRKVHKCDFDFRIMCGTWSTVLERKFTSSAE